MKLVSVFMDVEDPINFAADDAAKEFADLFSDVGVAGSFCVTGEKCRTLIQRGRYDVLNALAPHTWGLHTDTHSYHPSTMENLADCTFEEGCERAFATEGRGVAAFKSAFGRTPAFWGGAGNTWSIEITDALQRLGISAYVYALTAIPDEGVHRLNGIVALPQAVSISEADWMDDDRARVASERALARIDEVPQPWIGVFVGHPTRMRHVDYWDWPFYGGLTPDKPGATALVPDDDYGRAKANLRSFLSRLRERHTVVSVPEALTRAWRFRQPSASESAFFGATTAANLRSAVGWPVHRSGLSADNIIAKTLSHIGSLEVGEL